MLINANEIIENGENIDLASIPWFKRIYRLCDYKNIIWIFRLDHINANIWIENYDSASVEFFTN